MSRLALQPSPQAAAVNRLRSLAFHLQPNMDAMLESSEDKIRVVTHTQYNAADTLTPSTVLPSPLEQFRRWLKEAQSRVREPDAMCLSTATKSGIPSSRIVLLKEVDSRGFVFFTNYESRKSRELEENPHAALAFYWREMHKQVRVVGRVEKVSREESVEYFRTRPLGSRIGAWASPQSRVIQEGELSRRFHELREKFGISEDQIDDPDFPVPDFWGGWRIVPFEVEFWAGRPSRLHDRVRYTREENSNGDWKIERIAP